MKKRLFRALALLPMMAAAACYAQFNASVQGTVQDPKGAVVSGASLVLTKADTGVMQKTTSNVEGIYHFDSLAPGNYTVSGVAAGFSELKVSFELTTDQVRDVPLTLTVGQVSSTVTVTTQAPLLDTSDSRFEATLGTTALQDLPMPGRNPTSEIYLTPGVTGLGSSAALNFNPENYVSVSANGQDHPARRTQPDAERRCGAGSDRADQHVHSGLRTRGLDPDGDDHKIRLE